MNKLSASTKSKNSNDPNLYIKNSRKFFLLSATLATFVVVPFYALHLYAAKEYTLELFLVWIGLVGIGILILPVVLITGIIGVINSFKTPNLYLLILSIYFVVMSLFNIYIIFSFFSSGQHELSPFMFLFLFFSPGIYILFSLYVCLIHLKEFKE